MTSKAKPLTRRQAFEADTPISRALTVGVGLLVVAGVVGIVLRVTGLRNVDISDALGLIVSAWALLEWKYWQQRATAAEQRPAEKPRTVNTIRMARPVGAEDLAKAIARLDAARSRAWPNR